MKQKKQPSGSQSKKNKQNIRFIFFKKGKKEAVRSVPATPKAFSWDKDKDRKNKN